MFWCEIALDIRYSLIKAKLKLQNNNPNIYIKDKNDLKHVCYYSYRNFV